MVSSEISARLENTADRATLVALCRTLLPATAILHEDDELRPYECDGLSAYREKPLIVCLPENLDQLCSLVKLCYDRQVPVVARGAGTGLSGGALPLRDGMLISLARFNNIVDIDVANRVARVEPGVRNLAISEAVAPHGLYYAPDPSSQIACSIGGNVAENAGGVHCLKYGLTVHNVLGLKLLTMEGELLTIGGARLDNPGYDLLALLNGSEGLLGIIVEVTVKLLPIPERAQVVLAAFDDVEKAGAAVSRIIAAGIVPAGLEMMDRLAIRAAEDHVHAGYPTDAAAILLCELDGDNAEVSEYILRVHALLEECGAVEIRTAVDEAERKRLWAGRKAAFAAIGRLAPDYYCMDGTIPRHRLPEVLKQISQWSEEYGLPVANVFHAGDGNLHPLILYDANRPGELARTEEFGGRVLELCIAAGGTITGEHGVGMEKINQMCLQFTTAELEQFHAIKYAFDPHGLLNPGKAVPTLARCAEFGAMHVHRGQLPFPDIERF
ncbi:MAG: glycolate oxidase [Gammaproteobacteria bacterium]|nr:MAG: glycolate oxidase [Gammaproteobacteria bacterium]TND05019.1 MAG: glycolate oxidase [Gammaproteobacteria bacterium]